MMHDVFQKRIDAHCHLWALERGDYHWMDVSDPSFAPIARDFDTSDLARARGEAGVSDVVLVQAAATEAETEYLLSLANEHEEIKAVVGWVDLNKKDANQQIDKFAENKKFKGIRPMLQDIEDTDWLINIPQDDVWEHMVAKGLRLDALVKPRHLSMITQFCLDHPNLPIVIDHCAKPEFAANDPARIDAWLEGILKIANDTHAYCKLSGLLTEMSVEQLPNAYDILKPLVDELIKAFGPERIMWGSDWPVLRLTSAYARWNDLTLALLMDLDPASQDAILFKTAEQFYGLEGVST
ncbi:MAG: amidohydrolase family protein [Lentilitoribacter sp.]